MNNLGVAYHQLGKDEEAAAQYHQALLLKPDFKEAKDNLGRPITKIMIQQI